MKNTPDEQVICSSGVNSLRAAFLLHAAAGRLFAGVEVRFCSRAQAADGVCQTVRLLWEQAGRDGRADGENLIAAAVGILAAVKQIQGRIADVRQRRFARFAVFGELQVQNDRFLAAAGVAAALAVVALVSGAAISLKK